jgi:hypothetical protein
MPKIGDVDESLAEMVDYELESARKEYTTSLTN